ncbi:penicillin-binding protein, partial [Bacillus vallismortis]|nr:penicillin-binding protein [Bacillus vallismortis]
KQIKQVTGTYTFDDYAFGNMSSSYAMGSAVKGATVLSGLQTGAINLNTVFQDEPLYIGKDKNGKKSWKNLCSVNIQRALEQSSNVFMFKTA